MTARKGFRRILTVVVICSLFSGYAGSMSRVCAGENDGENIYTQEEQEFIQSQGTLKVGYVADREPVSFQDPETGELGGVTRLLLDRIQEISGLRFEYAPLPDGPVTYDYLLGKHLDLVTSVEYNKENVNARGIMISQPYLSSRKVIVGHEGVTLADSAHLKIAVSTGSQTLKKVLAQMYPAFEIVDYETVDACFEAVDKGEADLLILNQFVSEYRMYKPKYKHLRVLPTKGLEDELCFSAVMSLEPDEAELAEKQRLIEILNKAIGQISEDEQADCIIRATLENPYHDTPADFLYRYRYAVMLLSGAAILVCVLLVLIVRANMRAARARENEEMRNQFLSTMSHEIRTPINGIIGLNYLMSQNMKNDEKMADYLKQSSSTARYLMTLVSDILDLSKLQKKMLKLEEKPFALDHLVAAVESIEGDRMRDKGIDFQVEKKILYPGLVGDEVRVEQVILNLLDNACKFTDAGGSVTFRVVQKLRRDGNVETEISVKDTGCGISEEFQKKIFDSFAQERSTVSKGNEGTGLGLSISYYLAQMMDGSLEVESRLKEGSCFTFTFLAHPASADFEGNYRLQPDRGGGEKIKVLVAEDNELNAEILIEMLREEGYETALAVNGAEAVEMFETSVVGEYGCILMDLMMPVKNGFEATKAIRALDRPDAGTVRIIACTANAFEEDRRKAIASGMDDFIPKPIDVNKLFEKLRR